MLGTAVFDDGQLCITYWHIREYYYSQEVGEQQVGDAELSVGVGEAPARRLEADLVVAVRRRV